MAESMARAACGKSRSAVRAGPRSERASTVRRSRRKLFFCAATQGGSRKVQSTKRVTRSQTGEGGGLLVSLVRQFRREYHCGLAEMKSDCDAFRFDYRVGRLSRQAR